MTDVYGPSNYVEPYAGGKPALIHVDANGGLILGAGSVAALLGSVRIQDGAGATLAGVTTTGVAIGAAAFPSLVAAAIGYAYDGASNQPLRTSAATRAANPSGVLAVGVFGWDGASYQQPYAIAPSTAADALGAGNTGLEVISIPYVFDGVSFGRHRTASAANLGATSGLGAALVSEPGEWAITNAPAANVVATATRAAAAGTRHILKSLFCSAVGQAAAVAVIVTVVVRDGASGAGAILFQRDMVIPGALTEAKPVEIPALHIVGTAGNAMTVEFLAAGGANTLEKVSASGYDAT